MRPPVCISFPHTNHDLLCVCVCVVVGPYGVESWTQHFVCESRYLMKHTCGPTGYHNTRFYHLSAAKHTQSLSVCMCVCIACSKNKCTVYVCVFASRANQSPCVSTFDCFGQHVWPNSCTTRPTTTLSLPQSKNHPIHKLSF